MVLCDTEIRAALRAGQIILDPLPPPENIQTTAVDLTLGSEFKRWRHTHAGGVEVSIDPSHPKFDYANVAADTWRMRCATSMDRASWNRGNSCWP
jgi:deoxycytidine triphosphate deaminase